MYVSVQEMIWPTRPLPAEPPWNATLSVRHVLDAFEREVAITRHVDCRVLLRSTVIRLDESVPVGTLQPWKPPGAFVSFFTRRVIRIGGVGPLGPLV